jgi:hypothetical protein
MCDMGFCWLAQCTRSSILYFDYIQMRIAHPDTTLPERSGDYIAPPNSYHSYHSYHSYEKSSRYVKEALRRRRALWKWKWKWNRNPGGTRRAFDEIFVRFPPCTHLAVSGDILTLRETHQNTSAKETYMSEGDERHTHTRPTYALNTIQVG